MYDEFVKLLRKHYDKAPMVIQASDIIEKLARRCSFLESCINDALDALDRGADNDWAREALEKAEPSKEDL